MSFTRKYLRQSPIFKYFREFQSVLDHEQQLSYECVVEVVKDSRIRIVFGSTECCVEPVVALEMAECLRDAFNVSIFGYEDPWNERDLSVDVFTRYRPGGEHFKLVAEGEVEVTNATPDIFSNGKSTSGTANIRIGTAPGGYEFAFDFAHYTFSQESATWLCFRLQDACQHIDEICDG